MDCTPKCLSQEDKPEFADDEWHDLDCPNHSVKCCPYNEDNFLDKLFKE